MAQIAELLAQARQQVPEDGLKVTAFLPHRSVGRLVQHSSQVFIPFGRAAAVVLFGAFVLARTGAHPGGQLGNGLTSSRVATIFTVPHRLIVHLRIRPDFHSYGWTSRPM
jgi:hypothetical protein